MTLQAIKDSLLAVGCTVHHFFAPSGTVAPYIVWAEDGEAAGSLWCDDTKCEQVISGTVDYYTKIEADPNVEAIQAALNSLQGVSWLLASVQYEEALVAICYEWEWEYNGEF